MERAKGLHDESIIGKFDDIDVVVKLSSKVEDVISDAMIHEFIDSLRCIFININNANADDQVILFTEILYVAPKVILSRPQRNVKSDVACNEKIRLYKDRTMALKNLDADKMLRYVSKIQCQQHNILKVIKRMRKN